MSEDVAEFLKGQMERKPTRYELKQFEEYVSGDIYEWLRDNWTEHIRYEYSVTDASE